ncbi:MAG: glycosyltransferase, partial [Streptosporangiaceae bacterium]
DVLLPAGQVMFGGYRIAEGLGLPSMGLALQPIHPTGQFPPPSVTTRSLGRWGNRAISRAVLAIGGTRLDKPSKPLWATEGMPGFGMRAMLRRQDAARWPVFYGFSPAVVPRPPDWRDGLEVAGYWWPDRAADWTPPAELTDFLNAGSPPVFVGFGSRNPDDAGQLNAMLAAARRQAGVRMVIQAGWSGLAAADQADADQAAGDDAITIGDAPHDWLFPRMAAVVHGAGAGTAAAGLRAGVPAVTVPMIIDQPFWAGRLTACGVGPAPVPYRQLSTEALATAIKDAVTRESYRQRAQALAAQLATENGAAPIVKALAHLQ